MLGSILISQPIISRIITKQLKQGIQGKKKQGNWVVHAEKMLKWWSPSAYSIQSKQWSYKKN